MKLKKRGIIRIISYNTALIAGLFAACLIFYDKSVLYKRQIDASYMSSISQLVTSMSNIDVSLKKSIYTSDAYLSQISAAIWKEASSAKAILTSMPCFDMDLDKTSKFISQSGEYAYSILKRVSNNEPITSVDRENLKSLSKSAQALSQELISLKNSINDGGVSLNDIKSMLARREDYGVNASSDLSGQGEGPAVSNLQGDFPEYASLIYDGPYSDHIASVSPSLLEGKTEMSDDELLASAANLFGTDKRNIAVYDGSNGKIKTAYFVLNCEDFTYEAELTRIGGYILNYSNTKRPIVAEISSKDAIDAAKEFLNKIGITSMKESYFTVSGNIMTINLAYTQNNVICYPDLVKVSVSLQDGEILGFESYNYIMHHKQRQLPEQTVGIEQARQKIDSALTILSSGEAIIPTSGQNEVYCYEFKAISGEDVNYIVYINAQTGMEQDILILLQSDNGTLTV